MVIAPVEIEPTCAVQGLQMVCTGVELKIVSVVSPVALHANVLLPPLEVVVGVAANELMVGGSAVCPVSVLAPCMVLPPLKAWPQP